MKTNTGIAAKNSAESLHRIKTTERLTAASIQPADELLAVLHSGPSGLSQESVASSREMYGQNVVAHGRKEPVIKRFVLAFVSPFTAILVVLATVSVFTDIVFVVPADRNYVTVAIITTMVMFSGILRFIQEMRSGNSAARLSQMIHTTTCVERAENGKAELPLNEVVVGDIIFLSAGDMVPADMRVLFAKDLFINQSSLTGESASVEKQSSRINSDGALTECTNLVFMGSTVISGSAKAVVIAVGNDTVFGSMAKLITAKPPKTSFEKGVNSVSKVLIRFMLVMVPIVLFVNGFTKGDWLQATLFAISIAVGLTPEMLPMIVTTALAKGAVTMSRKKVIIKNLNAIQNLGSIDILCTDKTGTLTQDKVVLEYHLDIHGNENDRVLRHAFLNSYYQTGLKNLIDIAIINEQRRHSDANLETAYTKVDEIPFDFNRRRMSVVVADHSGKTQLITKGAVEEMLECCVYAEYNGVVQPITGEIRSYVLKKTDELNAQGMRVIAVAHKTNPAPVGQFSVADESDMVLLGFLAFLDPPKETAEGALNVLQNHGVAVKILTGDNENVTMRICRLVGLHTDTALLGPDIELMNDDTLAAAVENTTVFAKLSPVQKARVVEQLRKNGHSVGYMGDGINDAAAMKAADVGISVDTAVDIAKESASVILLEKDLNVLEDGIVEGRKTYANMSKYIKMTASSNFGNMFSVLTASAFLPFLPMAALQLILLNLIYDLTCTAIPWDNVDAEYLARPRTWDASSVTRFMLNIGPMSSVFDILTYLLMYFIICPSACGGLHYHQISDSVLRAQYAALFQTGWFIESMWSQTLVIHMIRTSKIPFIQSRASVPVIFLTFSGIATLTCIPFTPVASYFGLVRLPAVYFGWLVCIIVCYMILVTFMKMRYIRKYGELL
jgi:Mg2+-importing ATPase